MFYSHDLLGRKTPLGAIWTLAHGRKLSKGKIISINLREICDEILAPGVPHSLRLQGILIGGVVIVYNKQQAYLLEDLQEMMRRVKAAGRQPVGNKASDGAATDSKATTKGGKRKKDRTTANLGDITAMDLDDLAGADIFNDSDFLGLMGPLSSSFSSGSSGLGRPGRLGANQLLEAADQVGDDLFAMPSTDGETSEHTGTTSLSQGGRKASKSRSRSRSVSFAEDGHLEQHHPYEPPEEEVYGGLGPNAHKWNLDEEMFDVQIDLLEGLDIPGTTQPAATTPINKTSTAADAGDSTRTASDAAQPSTSIISDQQAPADRFDIDMDQQLTLPDTDEQLPGERTPVVEVDDVARARDQQAEGEQEEDREGQPANEQHGKQGVMKARAKSRKRRADQAFVDDLDNLQIKTQEYREWMADSSPVVNQQLKSKSTASAVVLAGAATDLQDPSKLLTVNNVLPGGLSLLAPMGGVTLCPELLELYRVPVQLMQAPSAKGGRAKGVPETPDSPEVNNSTGEGHLPRLQRVHRQPLPLEHVSGPAAGPLHGDQEHGYMPEQEEEHDMLSNDEAHDQLMDLPFGGGEIEVERLRAANTPNTGSLHMSSPGGTGTAARALQFAGRRAGSSTSNDSALRPMQLDDEVQSGAAALKGLKRSSKASSADLDDPAGMFFGAGNLADLLPDIEMPAEEDEHMPQQHTDDEGSMGAAGRSLAGSGSQLPLLEETEPSQPTQAGTQLQQSGLVTQASKLVLCIFHDRLQRAEEQRQLEAAADDASDGTGDAAAPSISLFSIMREGRLSRTEAAKLFYQVCVTTSVGFISVEQERPFADIKISAGPSM